MAWPTTRRTSAASGFLVGDCVFDVARTFNGTGFRMREHIDRSLSFSPGALDPKVKNFSRMNFNMAELEAADVDPEGWPILTDSRGSVTEGVATTSSSSRTA